MATSTRSRIAGLVFGEKRGKYLSGIAKELIQTGIGIVTGTQVGRDHSNLCFCVKFTEIVSLN